MADDERLRRILDSAESLSTELHERRDPTLQQRKATPIEALENAECIRPSIRGDIRVRVICRTPYDAYRSWTLIARELDVDEPFIVREATWLRQSNQLRAYGEVGQRGSSYAPSDDLWIRDAVAPPEGCQALTSRLDCVAMPLDVAPCGVDLEADDIEVILPRGGAELRIRFQGKVPPGWQAVAQWARDFRAFVGRCLG